VRRCKIEVARCVWNQLESEPARAQLAVDGAWLDAATLYNLPCSAARGAPLDAKLMLEA
jgi:hypothetical protein